MAVLGRLHEKLADLGFTENDIPKLVELVKTTPSLDGLCAMSPIPATDKVITDIFTKSLTALNA